MRWVSLVAARQAAADALRRFPLPLLCAFAAAALTDWQIIFADRYHSQLAAITIAAGLGIPLYFALALYRERRATATVSPRREPPLLELLGLFGLVLFAVYSPHW